MPAVIQPKIVRNARQNDQIRVFDRLSTMMPHLQRILLAEQASGHAAEIDGNAQFGDRGCQSACLLRFHHCPAADQQQWFCRRAQLFDHMANVRNGMPRIGNPRQRFIENDCVLPREQVPGMSIEILLDHFLFQGFWRFGRIPIPSPHQFLIVESIDRALNKHRARNSFLGHGKSLFQGWSNLPDFGNGRRPFHVRLHQRHLVNVLQSAASFQYGCSRPAQEHER